MVSLEALRKAKSATEKLIETARKLNVATDDLGALSFAINEEIAKLEEKKRDRHRITLQEFRSDLEVLTGYATFHTTFETAIRAVRSNIKDMEAAEAAGETTQAEPPETEANPWRKHKRVTEECRKSIYENETTLVDYIDHLVSELAEKDKRIAELDIAYYHVNNEADQLTKRLAKLAQAESQTKPADDDYVSPPFAICGTRRVKYVVAGPLKPRSVADTEFPEDKPDNLLNRTAIQRRIKMQRRELRRLNKALIDLNHSRMTKNEQFRDLQKRVKELETLPPPLVTKLAEELVVGDTIIASGQIRKVTAIRQDLRLWQVACDGWGRWYENKDLVPVFTTIPTRESADAGQNK